MNELGYSLYNVIQRTIILFFSVLIILIILQTANFLIGRHNETLFHSLANDDLLYYLKI